MKLGYKFIETDLTDWAPTTPPETTRVLHRGESTSRLDVLARRYAESFERAQRVGLDWTEPSFVNEREQLQWEVSRRAYLVSKAKRELADEARKLVAKQCDITAQENELQKLIDQLNGKHEAAE